MKLDNEEIKKIIDDEDRLMSLTTRVPYFPLIVDHAEGSYIYDIEGDKYLDLLASAAVMNVGHSNERILRAITEQAKKFIHYTPAYAYHTKHTELAKKLVEIAPIEGEKRVAFGLSGSASVDGALKAAKAYTGRDHILSFHGSYHGTTYGSLSVSGYSSHMRGGMGSLLPNIHFAKFPDYFRSPYKNATEEDMACIDSILKIFESEAAAEDFAAIITEPIQGDGGILTPSKYFTQKLNEICEEHGILLIVDEVHSGFGRTGELFSSRFVGLKPDIMVLGKAIASGMPLSGLVAKKEIFESWSAPKHFFNTAGNPVSCAAAIENIDILMEEGFLAEVYAKGNYFKNKLKENLEDSQIVGDIRGEGLMIGIDIVKDKETKERNTKDTSKICWRAFEKGLILAFFSSNVLRIAPPLTISFKEIDIAVEKICQTIREVEESFVPDSVLEFVKGW